MPSIYQLKPAFQNLLRPIVKAFARTGITANMVTLSAILLSAFAGAVIYWKQEDPTVLLIVPLVLFVRMALNAIDGMLAREHDMKTDAGAFLNELGDVFADAFLYIPFALFLDERIVVTCVLLAVISEMTGVIGVQIGASRRYDGPMGKSDRAFVFGLLAFLLGTGYPFGLPDERGLYLNYLLVAVACLIFITVLNRMRMALKEKR